MHRHLLQAELESVGVGFLVAGDADERAADAIRGHRRLVTADMPVSGDHDVVAIAKQHLALRAVQGIVNRMSGEIVAGVNARLGAAGVL